MKNLGDITKIDGHTAPMVDIITGGSPCQDLSVAGKRQGLAGERSGLFIEQIRIIKEMREESERRLRDAAAYDRRLVKPRFMVWENVPGAFSSNSGEDFRCVLEETARVADKDAVIPGLEGKQKWTPSGVILADGWSIAWRVHDAQFWGVPQRRKRISLVADFAGGGAPEILFERKGVPGNTQPGAEERQGASGAAAESTGVSSYTLKIRGGVDVDSKGKKAGKGALVQEELSGTLGVSQDQTLITLEGNGSRPSHRGEGYKESETMFTLNGTEKHGVCYGISGYHSNAMKSTNPKSGIYKADTSRTLDLNGGSPACNQGGIAVVQDKEVYSVDMGGGKSSVQVSWEKAPTLATTHYGEPAVTQSMETFHCTTEQERDGTCPGHHNGVVYGLDRASFNQGKNAKFGFAVEEELSPPIIARGPGGAVNWICWTV